MMILAFLQNPWFEKGTDAQTIERYKQLPYFRRKVLARTMTGKRLKLAFGDMFDRIIWDNASYGYGHHHSKAFPADLQHMSRSICTFKPDLVLTFGVTAYQAMIKISINPNARILSCHHPNARYRSQEDLNGFAETVKQHYELVIESNYVINPVMEELIEDMSWRCPAHCKGEQCVLPKGHDLWHMTRMEETWR